MMMLMTGGLIVAFGLLAVFAVVRFRNVLKDTRDTSYILWAILQGLAVGTFKFSTAVIAAQRFDHYREADAQGGACRR